RRPARSRRSADRSCAARVCAPSCANASGGSCRQRFEFARFRRMRRAALACLLVACGGGSSAPPDAASPPDSGSVLPDADLPDAPMADAGVILPIPTRPIVILMIGDGMGSEHIKGAGHYKNGAAGSLFMETLPV